MKVIIDENLPPSWCDFLEQAGVTAKHWSALGNVGDPDSVIFDFATHEHWMILTQDLDFTRLLALRGTQLPSVMQLRVDCPIPSLVGEVVLRMLELYGAKLEEGALISLEADQHRVRILPLR